MLRNICNYNTYNLQLYLLTLRESQITRLGHLLVYCSKLHGPLALLFYEFYVSKWYVLSEFPNNPLYRSLTLLSPHPPFYSDNNTNIKFFLLPCKQWWFLSDCLGMQREQLHQTFKTLLLYPLNPFLTLLLLWYLQISSIWYWLGIISSPLLFHCVHLAFFPR